MHRTGKVISVEVWDDDEIVGGLYGIDLGDIFCGESMFSKSSNSSKVALYYLVKELKKNQYKFIDCQVPSETLKKFRRRKIFREKIFLIY